MGLPNKALETVRQPTLLLSSPGMPEHPTPPEQIWFLLTPEQHQTVFQVLVQVCHRLMSRGHTVREVCDEHP